MLWASLVHGFSIIGLIDLRNVVASISCDKAVWDAILNNRAVQDLRGSISADMASEATSQSKGKGKGYFTWTPEMDRVMGTCFIDQMNQGNKLDGKCAWKTAAYTVVMNALFDKLNISVTKANILSRFKTWEKHYDILYPLLQSCNSGSAIIWDYSRGRIVEGY